MNTSFTFTNCGASGQYGPTLAQCQSSYSGTSWTQNTSYFNMTTQGYQLWTVPVTGTYTITVAGAVGGQDLSGNHIPGSGIILTFTITLNINNILCICIGQSGGPNTWSVRSYYDSTGGGSAAVDNFLSFIVFFSFFMILS